MQSFPFLEKGGIRLGAQQKLLVLAKKKEVGYKVSVLAEKEEKGMGKADISFLAET